MREKPCPKRGSASSNSKPAKADRPGTDLIGCRLSVMPIIIAALVMTLIFSAAAEAQPNLGASVMDDFVSRTTGWWSKLRDFALYIFKITAMLEVCLFGIRMVIQKSQLNEIVGQFVMLMLFICFIAAVIMNYKDWAEAVAIKGLKPIADSLSGGVSADAGSPVAMIFACLEAMVPVLGDAGIMDIGMVMVYVFCMGAIIAVFAIICCRYIIVICEFHIVANAGVLLIGLGGSKIFKDYAISVMRYILSVAIKLFVFQLVLNIGFSILSLSDVQALQGQSIKNISLFSLVGIIVQGAILLGLSWTLPQTCAGLLSGASVDAGNPLRMIGAAVSGKGLTAIAQGGTAIMQKAQNIRTASKIATQEGVRGFGNRVQHMRQTLNNANMAANPSSVQNQLKSQLNAGKAMTHLDRPAPATPAASAAAPTSAAANSTASAPKPSSMAATSGPRDMTKAPKFN